MDGHRRTQRLNELLKRELSRLLRDDLKDPRVRTATITEVRVSPDLAQATVYVRTLGEEVSTEEAIEGLESAAGFLRGRLGRELRLRRAPEFRFVMDRTLEKAQRIEELLADVRSARGDDGGDGSTTD